MSSQSRLFNTHEFEPTGGRKWFVPKSSKQEIARENNVYIQKSLFILFFVSSACPSDLSLKSLKPSSSGPAFLSACLCSADLRIIPNRISQGIIGSFSPFSERSHLNHAVWQVAKLETELETSRPLSIRLLHLFHDQFRFQVRWPVLCTLQTVQTAALMATSSRPVSPSAFCIVYRRSSSMGQMGQPKKLGHAGSKGSLLIFTYLHRGFKTQSLQSCSLQMPSSSHFSGLFTCYICTSGIIRSMPSSLLAIFLGTFFGTPQGEK